MGAYSSDGFPMELVPFLICLAVFIYMYFLIRDATFSSVWHYIAFFTVTLAFTAIGIFVNWLFTIVIGLVFAVPEAFMRRAIGGPGWVLQEGGCARFLFMAPFYCGHAGLYVLLCLFIEWGPVAEL